MIAEAGLAALWLAAALSLLQLGFAIAALWGGEFLTVSEAHGEGDHVAKTAWWRGQCERPAKR